MGKETKKSKNLKFYQVLEMRMCRLCIKHNENNERMIETSCNRNNL